MRCSDCIHYETCYRPEEDFDRCTSYECDDDDDDDDRGWEEIE